MPDLFQAVHRIAGRRCEHVKNVKGYRVYAMSPHVLTVTGGASEKNLCGMDAADRYLSTSRQLVISLGVFRAGWCDHSTKHPCPAPPPILSCAPTAS